jgi:uncharacterized protein (DUF362 family)
MCYSSSEFRILRFLIFFLIFSGDEKHMASKSKMTRREMLAGAAGAAAAASLSGLAGCFPTVGGAWPDAGPQSMDAESISTCGCDPPDGGAAVDDNQPNPVLGSATVVTIQRNDSIDAKGKSLDQPQLDAVQSMVDAVLSALAGGVDNPWPVLLPTAGPCTRIGLKVNCLNPYFPTSPAVVRAIIKSLQDKQHVCPGNIVVWDRRLDELNGAGKYTDVHLQGARMVGTIRSTKDLSGPGYSSASFGTFQGSTPRLSRILTEQTDITINCPVLKAHNQSGVTAGLKNIFGIIDIPGNFHTDTKQGISLPTALPALYNIPKIRNSIKLTIVDALQAVALGDTASMPDAIPGRIFAATDPLALDRYALDLINQLRAARKQQPVSGNIVGWLDNAYLLGLGTKDYNLVTLSSDGALPAMDGGGAVDVADPAG